MHIKFLEDKMGVFVGQERKPTFLGSLQQLNAKWKQSQKVINL